MSTKTALASHCAIVGNSGSGKTVTAKVRVDLFAWYQFSRFGSERGTTFHPRPGKAA